jgi:hypothetical protein
MSDRLSNPLSLTPDMAQRHHAAGGMTQQMEPVDPQTVGQCGNIVGDGLGVITFGFTAHGGAAVTAQIHGDNAIAPSQFRGNAGFAPIPAGDGEAVEQDERFAGAAVLIVDTRIGAL